MLAEVLAALGTGLAQSLLGVLRGDEDADVRDAAYEALVRLARVREMGESGGG